MKKYWYLWLGNGGDGKILAAGPVDSMELVDSLEQPIRDYCEKHYSNYSYFWESGGCSFTEDQGPGKLNFVFARNGAKMKTLKEFVEKSHKGGKK